MQQTPETGTMGFESGFVKGVADLVKGKDEAGCGRFPLPGDDALGSSAEFLLLCELRQRRRRGTSKSGEGRTGEDLAAKDVPSRVIESIVSCERNHGEILPEDVKAELKNLVETWKGHSVETAGVVKELDDTFMHIK